MMTETKKPKIGLALGSGGARGMAHIGVIKVLEKEGIPIDCIAGTSIGALVGGLYAFFGEVEKLEKAFLETRWRRFFSLFGPSFKGGLLSQNKLEKYFREKIGKVNIEDLKIKFASITTDFLRGTKIKLDKGDLVKAMLASISVPIIFKPYVYDKKLLADGGLIDPVPVEEVKKMGADIVIAVDLQSKYFAGKKSDLFNFGMRALEIFEIQLSREQLKKADIVIKPEVEYVSWNKFVKPKEVIAKGQKATTPVIQKIRKLLKQ